MDKNLNLAIQEAMQIFQLADNTAHSLYKILIKENPLAADFFLQILNDSAKLRQKFESLNAAINS